jgi:RimJ/RimL family protein N-acetyltransferase
MFHRSERLFLRPVFAEDWQAVYRGICDEGVAVMLAGAPWPYRKAHAREFVTMLPDAANPRLAITLPGEPGAPLIGVASLHSENGEAAIGFWLAREHWGCGYATEAVRALCEISRALGHTRLHAGHFLDNPRAGRVLRKAGFVETGEVCPVESRARGGEVVLTRRFVLDLIEPELVGERGQMRAA